MEYLLGATVKQVMRVKWIEESGEIDPEVLSKLTIRKPPITVPWYEPEEPKKPKKRKMKKRKN